MFDTHCHLNFSAFKKTLDATVAQAQEAGITQIVVPGTDIPSSRKAIEIARKHNDVYAAVGIHPHHVYELRTLTSPQQVEIELTELESLLKHDKVVAVGEVGIDRYIYTQTKYKEYAVTDEFVQLQKELFVRQLKLAVAHQKSLIIHNREAKADLLELLEKHWHAHLEGRTVLHCCEPEKELLDFALTHKIYLGVDGDVTYSEKKQEFLKHMVGVDRFLQMYVLETDAPFLLPEPLRTQKAYPNKPQNIAVIAQFLAHLFDIPISTVQEHTTLNAQKLFGLY